MPGLGTGILRDGGDQQAIDTDVDERECVELRD
jgi:hypothetical protein